MSEGLVNLGLANWNQCGFDLQLTSKLTIPCSEYQALFYFILKGFVCFYASVSCYLIIYCYSIENIYPVYLGERVPKLSFKKKYIIQPAIAV